MSEIDYQRCTLQELLDVKENINRDQYPERYTEVLRQISLREKEPTTEEFPPTCRICPSFLVEKRIKPHVGAGKTVISYLAGDVVFYVLFLLTVGCWAIFPFGFALAASLLVTFYVIYLFQKEKVILVCPTCKEEYSISEFET